MTTDFYPFHDEYLAGKTREVANYDDMTSCIDDAEKIAGNSDYYAEVFANLRHKASTGVQDVVEKSDAMLSKIESQIDLAGIGRRVMPAVAGGAVNVPAMLSGSPMAMRQRRRVNDAQSGELAIFINTFGGLATSRSIYKHRSPAIIALIRAIGAVRPVSLYLFELTDDKCLTTIKLHSNPIDLARMSWATGTDEFTLGTVFWQQRAARCYNGISCAHDDVSKAVLSDWAAKRDIPSALILPRMMTSADFSTTEGAVDWVQGHLATYSGMGAAA